MDQVGALSPAEIDQWVNSAEPGDSEVYAWGGDLPRAAPGVVAAKTAYRRGLVTFTQRRRSDGRWDFIMQRIAKRARAAASKGHDDPTDPDFIILQELRRAAANRRPCPSNEMLARKAGLPDESAASYVVKKLKKRQKIHVELVGPMKRRRVTIVSSGAQTALSEAGCTAQ